MAVEVGLRAVAAAPAEMAEGDLGPAAQAATAVARVGEATSRTSEPHMGAWLPGDRVGTAGSAIERRAENRRVSSGPQRWRGVRGPLTFSALRALTGSGAADGNVASARNASVASMADWAAPSVGVVPSSFNMRE